jgi:hypothetical protein
MKSGLHIKTKEEEEALMQKKRDIRERLLRERL